MGYHASVDIYAFGMCIVEMITVRRLWQRPDVDAPQCVQWQSSTRLSSPPLPPPPP